MSNMKRITIVGGGASGTLVAVNLLKKSDAEPLLITLIEKQNPLGGGVAFSTSHDLHLLNVPAGKMSAFPDEPYHFHEWLASNGFEYAPSDFVPRKLYGRYLKELLDNAIAKASPASEVKILNDEATDVAADENSAAVVLSSGDQIASDKVVLAFGNFPPPHPSVPDLRFTEKPKYVHNVWGPNAMDAIGPEDTVLVIGTGLSMVDVALRLNKMGHKGEILAISTRGLLPAVHKLGFAYEQFNEKLLGYTRITDLLKEVRGRAKNAAASESDWRAVIDSIRPATQQIWQGLPTAEKRYFMQHLSRHWNVARHRMAPQIAERLAKMTNAGEFRILSGRLKHISVTDNDRFLINYTVNGGQNYLEADAVINCIASQANFSKIESALVKNMLASGTLRCDELRLGLDASPDGALKDKDGNTSTVLYTLGTALKGILWETTAIPEIRTQARDLADTLLSR